MLINDYLKEECIDISLSGENKEEVIKKLLDLILKSDPGINREEVLEDLFAREKLESTAIGNGVVIPHARVEKTSEVTPPIRHKIIFRLDRRLASFSSPPAQKAIKASARLFKKLKSLIALRLQ